LIKKSPVTSHTSQATAMNVNNMDSTGDIETDGYGNSLTSMLARGRVEDEGKNEENWITTSQGDIVDTNENAVVLELFFLCERASEEDLESWGDVRQWLREHTTSEAREAAMMTGDDNATSLYLACRKCAPVDIVEVLIGIAPQTARMANNLGWLPMHIACHFGASLEVLRILAEAYPESMKSMDKRGRTPLHFALGNVERPVTPAAVLLLLSSNAGKYPDMGGMLPLHYACAYGASEAVLNVLLEGNHETITARDNKGRTPLHYAMGNCTRDASPAIVRTLLLNNPLVVNMVESEGGFLPLHMLATAAEKLTLDQDGPVSRTNAQACLDHYLNAKPNTTTEFFTTFQKLPSWLIDHAVQSPIVQMILNRKIAERFPTFILIGDFYALIAIIIFYYLAVKDAIEKRTEPGSSNQVGLEFTSFLFLSGTWFALREILQIFSYIDLGIFDSWLYDVMNYLDVSQVVVVFGVAIITRTGSISESSVFRMLVAFFLPFPFIKTMLFLRSLSVEFSVFTNGMLNVLVGLKVFFIALILFVLMFTTSFKALFFKSPWCKEPDNESEPLCQPGASGTWQAFLFTFNMLLGEVQSDPFIANADKSPTSVIFFVLFMVVVVVLLANVLIAIVTEHYSLVRNERASIVFWRDRLDFIAEMDALTNFLFNFTNKFSKDKSVPHSDLVSQENQDSSIASNTIPSRSRDEDKYYDHNTWDGLMEIFEPSDDLLLFSWEFFLLTLLRLCALIAIPIWLVLGFIPFGLLLPGQVRRRMLSTKSDNDKVGGNQNDYRLNQLKVMHKGMKQWQESVEIEMASDRKNVIVIKNTVMELQSDVMRQMKEIKQIMTMLFEIEGALEMD